MERFWVLLLFGGLLLQLSKVGLAIVPSNATDQLALLAFKKGISFDSNNILVRNWSTGTSYCNWIGVSCSTRRKRVTALKLPGMGLQGTISPHIGNLSFLQLLDLSNNSFHGHVGHELGHLHRLKELVLQGNQLKGRIPSSLYQCRALQIISLSYNNFSGAIPTELSILPQLHTLNLHANNLVGAIPLSLGNISSLKELRLEENRLIGSIPSIIFNITSLLVVSLAENYLSGSLPRDICHIGSKLEKIIVSDNQLTGHIPSTLHKCRNLTHLLFNGNRFEGSIPKDLGSLPMLQSLYLGQNNISGAIPPSLANNSRLKVISVEVNKIYGNIPNELALLSGLAIFNFAGNGLTGEIPQAIFNISTLQILTLSWNFLSGTLPSTTGIWLPNLEIFHLHINEIGGQVPLHLSNSSKLTQLLLNNNLFTGPVPTNLGNLQHLELTSLAYNQLTTERGNSELSFLNALTNIKSLKKMSLEHNPLNGFMPSSIGNHSSPLQLFALNGCQLHGHIPKGIGSFKNLNVLDLSNNSLIGIIPSTFGGLESLQRLFLRGNMLEGFIPNELCHLRSLGEIYLQSNKLSGVIPDCLGNLSRLQKLDLSSNRLTTSIPLSLWTLENLNVMNLSTNALGDYIPPNAKLDVIENLDLSSNQISGNIPSIIGNFQRLNSLNLSNNSLQGDIPETFGSLVALEFMDLSYNNLSGAIPKSLGGLKYLRQVNFSFNKLSGEIPSTGSFANLTAQSFLGNMTLCGNPALKVPPCSHIISRSNSKKKILIYVLPAIASLATLVAIFYIKRTCRTSNVQVPSPAATVPPMEWRMISRQELLRATNNFSEANLLGVGSVGSVYKGMLSDGIDVAIKVLNLWQEGAFKSFDAECKVFQTVRHRNLIKVLSSCSNPEFRALVLQYMSNGSLEKWLYSYNYFLNLFQRVSIMVDVALALEYLHHGLPKPVVHCDLKPSNVLLDEDMVAHVGDFGIAKILAENKTTSQTKTLGTLGYIAPEYGFEGRVSAKCDIYSYGITLLEVLTRKKPTDEMFSADLSLRQWVQEAFPDTLMEVVDGNLLKMEVEVVAPTTRNHLLAIFEIGLECSKELPEERSDIKDVVAKMKRIKSQLLGKKRV